MSLTGGGGSNSATSTSTSTSMPTSPIVYSRNSFTTPNLSGLSPVLISSSLYSASATPLLHSFSLARADSTPNASAANTGIPNAPSASPSFSLPSAVFSMDPSSSFIHHSFLSSHPDGDYLASTENTSAFEHALLKAPIETLAAVHRNIQKILIKENGEIANQMKALHAHLSSYTANKSGAKEKKEEKDRENGSKETPQQQWKKKSLATLQNLAQTISALRKRVDDLQRLSLRFSRLLHSRIEYVLEMENSSDEDKSANGPAQPSKNNLLAMKLDKHTGEEDDDNKNGEEKAKEKEKEKDKEKNDSIDDASNIISSPTASTAAAASGTSSPERTPNKRTPVRISSSISASTNNKMEIDSLSTPTTSTPTTPILPPKLRQSKSDSYALGSPSSSASSSPASVLAATISTPPISLDVSSTDWSFLHHQASRMWRLQVDYLLRHGFYQTAVRLADRTGIRPLTDVDFFLSVRRVLDGLRSLDSSKALVWCGENRSRLNKIHSNLEFEIRLAEFSMIVEKVRSGHKEKLLEAIEYSRKFLAPAAIAQIPKNCMLHPNVLKKLPKTKEALQMIQKQGNGGGAPATTATANGSAQSNGDNSNIGGTVPSQPVPTNSANAVNNANNATRNNSISPPAPSSISTSPPPGSAQHISEAALQRLLRLQEAMNALIFAGLPSFSTASALEEKASNSTAQMDIEVAPKPWKRYSAYSDGSGWRRLQSAFLNDFFSIHGLSRHSLIEIILFNGLHAVKNHQCELQYQLQKEKRTRLALALALSSSSPKQKNKKKKTENEQKRKKQKVQKTTDDDSNKMKEDHEVVPASSDSSAAEDNNKNEQKGEVGSGDEDESESSIEGLTLSQLELDSSEDMRSYDASTSSCPFCHSPLNGLLQKLPVAPKPNSLLLCRLSGLVMDEHNPPLVLPNGRVYSKKALQKMAHAYNGWVICPRTRQLFQLAQCKQAYII